MRLLLPHPAGEVRCIKQVPTADIENPFVRRRAFQRGAAAEAGETFAAH